jgi:hypothetical protein
MTTLAHARARNLSRLELALVVIVIAILFAVFMRRVERVEAAMERAMVNLAVQDLQSRLLMLAAEQELRRAAGGPASALDDNPLRLALPLLQNYVGERDTPDWSTIKPGQWVYVRASGTLEYRVVNTRYVDTGSARDPARIRLRLAPAPAIRIGFVDRVAWDLR